MTCRRLSSYRLRRLCAGRSDRGAGPRSITLEGITGFEVRHISGVVDGAATEDRVQLRAWFDLRERMHG